MDRGVRRGREWLTEGVHCRTVGYLTLLDLPTSASVTNQIRACGTLQTVPKHARKSWNCEGPLSEGAPQSTTLQRARMLAHSIARQADAVPLVASRRP